MTSTEVPGDVDGETPDVVWPAVSVVMPVLNEGPYLRRSVERVLADEYPGEVEIALAVGPSVDDTEAIAAQLATEYPVVVVPNPTGRTPAGLNAAIAATSNPVVVRVDGHGYLRPGYIRSAVQTLLRTGAANVGGVMAPHGETPFERAVAKAMSSPLGIGGARFHVGGEAGPADSVYLGVFRREVLEKLGGFDEHFTRAQDWELNHRIRSAGEVVWFDPSLQVTYRPRATFKALGKQFFGSGRWRREVVRHYPQTVSLRYLAPPLAVAGLAGGTLAGLVGTFGGPAWLRLGFAAPAVYAGFLGVAALVEGRDLDARARAWFPAVVGCMHVAWGTGFALGAGTSARPRP